MRLGKARRELCEEICPYELVTEDVQAKLAAVLARHKQLNSIEWLKPALRARNCALLTPFGTLQVSLQEGWKVFRNDEPLVHYRCDFWGQHDGRPAVFTDYDAAKGAALLHALDGWGVAYNFLEPTDTGLFWWLPQDVWAAQQVPEIRHDVFPSDLDDHYEFGGAEKLLPLIEPWGMPPARDILEDCKATCKAFRLPMPTWQRRAQGWFELKTAYELLVVRRQCGWIIEKNSAALCYMLADDPKVVCDNLQDAQALALTYAPSGDGRLYWKQAETTLDRARAGRAVELVLRQAA
jgi:hypothetical protein